MQEKIVMYMHGGSGNHGCEAIVNSTCHMLKNRVLLVTNSEEEDRTYTLGDLCDLLEERKIREHKAAHILYYGWRKLTGDRESFFRYRFREVIGKNRVPLYISIGGDNYCYPEIVDELIQSNKLFHRQGSRTILWGCSIEPELLKCADVVDDMKRYDLIVARESLTYQALLDAGITENVRLYPDPAFALEKADTKLPEGFAAGNTVGINLSPMIIRNEQVAGITLSNYELLIRHIITDTDMNVALIPHVVWKNDDDRKALRELYDRCSKSFSEQEMARICMVGDRSCQELKACIAACRMFIGARTHATIAAYSSCVPTLVVGYSVKARGIAKDLFGTEKDYVLPVQKLQKPEELLQAFLWLSENEEKQRTHLLQIMPGYCKRAEEAGELINTWAE